MKNIKIGTYKHHLNKACLKIIFRHEEKSQLNIQQELRPEIFAWELYFLAYEYPLAAI